MSPPTVREYESRDEQAVVALWQQAFPNDSPWNEPRAVIRRKLSVQPELFLVCEVDGRVVGAVVAGFDGVRGWVHHLAVLSEFRRRGLATRLMRVAEERLAGAGCPKLNLQVRGSNPEVVAFYESLGYAVEDRISLGKPLGQWPAT